MTRLDWERPRVSRAAKPLAATQRQCELLSRLTGVPASEYVNVERREATGLIWRLLRERRA